MHVWQEYGFSNYADWKAWIGSLSGEILQREWAQLLVNQLQLPPFAAPTVVQSSEFLAANSMEILEDGKVIGTAAITGTSVAAGGTGLYSIAGGVTSVALPVAAAAAATALGVGIGKVAGDYLYEANPEFWGKISDAVLPASLKFDGQPSALAQIPVIVKDGVSYLSESFLSLFKNALVENGAYSEGGIKVDNPTTNVVITETGNSATKGTIYSNYYNRWSEFKIETEGHPLTNRPNLGEYIDHITFKGTNYGISLWVYSTTAASYTRATFLVILPDELVGEFGTINTYDSNNYNLSSSARTISRVTVTANGETKTLVGYLGSFDGTIEGSTYPSTSGTNLDAFLLYAYLFGTSIPSIEGVTKEESAAYPTLTDPLSTTYPTWYESAISVSKPNATDISLEPTEEEKWLPISLPLDDVFVSDQTQTTTQDGEVTTTAQENALLSGAATLLEVLASAGIELPSNPATPDEGDVPYPIIPGTTSQLGMIAVYKPTLAELISFNQFLWSTNFIDVIKKLMQNPMDAVISLKQLYVTPYSPGRTNIVAGYIDSGVESDYIDQHFLTLYCGQVSIPNFYYNAIDYAPYTKIHIYLPFVGVQELNADDVVGGTISVQYNVDNLTGTCLAIVKCERDSLDAAIYSFPGNCAVELPLTGSSFGGLVAGLLTAGAAGLATVATGGAAAAALTHAAAGAIAGAKTHVSMSGNLGANAGALGVKKPYVMIQRPIAYDAIGFNSQYGFPENKTVQLSTLTGYTRVKSVHVDSINSATDEEKRLIEQALKQGVII